MAETMPNTMTDTMIREHILAVIMEKVSQDQDRRKEALTEYVAVTMPGVSDIEAKRLAELVPPVLPELYEKWGHLCIDRMLETIPRDQLEHICDGSKDNNSALLLVYIMFLESERMEKQIPEDLAAYGLEQTGADDMGDLAAGYIRAKMAKIRQDMN